MRKSEVDMCLNCKKPECDDCISNQPAEGKALLEYRWHEKMYSVRQLAKISGRDVDTIRYRLKVGGVDFAMSACRSLKEWKKRKNCSCCSNKELLEELNLVLKSHRESLIFCSKCGRKILPVEMKTEPEMP